MFGMNDNYNMYLYLGNNNIIHITYYIGNMTKLINVYLIFRLV